MVNSHGFQKRQQKKHIELSISVGSGELEAHAILLAPGNPKVHSIVQMCMQDMGDGIQVSNLGNCVVENDGSGIWVKPARMTTAEMQVRTPPPQLGPRSFAHVWHMCGHLQCQKNFGGLSVLHTSHGQSCVI